MKSAIYARVSTKRQVEEGFSLDAQESRCRAYAESQGWTVTEVYRDEGISGRSADRPAFQSLLSRASEYDRVIVFKMSRLGRSARDVLNAIHDFQTQGCEVVFVEDGLDTSKAAHRLIITVLAAVAEMESENNAEQVRAGMEQSAREGHWQGGPVPFGLRINDDGDLDIDPIPAEAIRKATDFILSGRTTREAADRLNARGFRPPRSSKWKSQELRRHLRSEHLSGVHTWSDVTREVPAVLDRGTWKRLQKALDETKLSRSGRNRVYTLSQRVTCTCGGTLVGTGPRHGDSRTKKQVYYRCGNHQGDRKGLCRCDHDEWPDRPKWWDATELEVAAWQELVWILRNKDLIEAAIDEHLGHTEDGFDEEALKKVTANVERLRDGLAQATADLYTTDDRLTHEKAIADIRGRLETAEAEKERLEALKADQKRADTLRVQWVATAEGLATFQGAAVPSPQEQADIYNRLNVRFKIAMPSEKRGDEGDPWQDKGDADVFVPFSNWIRVEGVELPSYNDSQNARPYP